jgi:hypothetical protein
LGERKKLEKEKKKLFVHDGATQTYTSGSENTVKASNFEPFLASSVASLDELCTPRSPIIGQVS